MDAPTATLSVGVLSAAIISLGWLYGRSQANRTRRLELLLNYRQRQIQEFYTPLYSNIQLIWNVRKIEHRLENELLEKDKERFKSILHHRYYAPLHEFMI